MFLGIAANADAVMELWVGDPSALGTGVLILYAIVFTLIAPAHLMTLMLIARGQHAVIGAVVFAESVINLGLSIVLVNAIGPIGPAISTLVVVGTDDLVVIPLLASSRLPIRASAIWSRMLAGYLVGGAIVAGSQLIPAGENSTSSPESASRQCCWQASSGTRCGRSVGRRARAHPNRAARESAVIVLYDA